MTTTTDTTISTDALVTMLNNTSTWAEKDPTISQALQNADINAIIEACDEFGLSELIASYHDEIDAKDVLKALKYLSRKDGDTWQIIREYLAYATHDTEIITALVVDCISPILIGDLTCCDNLINNAACPSIVRDILKRACGDDIIKVLGYGE
ncbi:MAG: hypothetical protein QXL94_00700 [Candidatus Parvarchaeum sp.]